ncbi:MAG: hypothetical protein Tsb0014_22390 [Pleurocapsa sp.]
MVVYKYQMLNEMTDTILVAEINFNRDLAPEKLRQLGAILLRCKNNQGWIASIRGIEELLKGECPQHYSKEMLFQDAEGKEHLIKFYDPLLVWAWREYPNSQSICPIDILSKAIPLELAKVAEPDPDGGV